MLTNEHDNGDHDDRDANDAADDHDDVRSADSDFDRKLNISLAHPRLQDYVDYVRSQEGLDESEWKFADDDLGDAIEDVAGFERWLHEQGMTLTVPSTSAGRETSSNHVSVSENKQEESEQQISENKKESEQPVQTERPTHVQVPATEQVDPGPETNIDNEKKEREKVDSEKTVTCSENEKKTEEQGTGCKDDDEKPNQADHYDCQDEARKVRSYLRSLPEAPELVEVDARDILGTAAKASGYTLCMCVRYIICRLFAYINSVRPSLRCTVVYSLTGCFGQACRS